MAITVSSRPNEYSNSSIFVTTTDIAEDSTHVNTRIEASLYVDGVVIAKKVKPKGITTFDFTEILKTKCLFTTPAIDDSSGTAIIDGGKTGSNLITGWTNNGFDICTTSGANWTQLETVSTGTNKVYTNDIAVTSGKKYVILFKSGTSEAGFTVQVRTTPANGNIITGAATSKRMYFEARTTGNIKLEFIVITTGVPFSFDGSWLMYELNTNDWFVPYYVVFTEKYEDAAGATQTGATSIESQLSLFFKSDAATFTDYICYTTQKFLKPDGYNLSSNARSYPILKTLPSGKRTSIFNLAVISNKNYQLLTRVTPYNSAGSPQTTIDSSLQDIYSPIIGIHLNQSIIETYPRADFNLKSAVSGGQASEVLQYNENSIVFPELIHLIWQNTKGGLSSYSFTYNINKFLDVKKEYYKDVNKKDKLIPTSIVKQNTLTAFTPISISENQLEFIQDILESNLVLWQYTADDLRAVTVKSETITTKNDNELIPFQIEITY